MGETFKIVSVGSPNCSCIRCRPRAFILANFVTSISEHAPKMIEFVRLAQSCHLQCHIDSSCCRWKRRKWARLDQQELERSDLTKSHSKHKIDASYWSKTSGRQQQLPGLGHHCLSRQTDLIGLFSSIPTRFDQVPVFVSQ